MAFACSTQTLAIVFSKIIKAVIDGNLVTKFYIAHSNHHHAFRTLRLESGVGIAVVIGETRRAQKQRRCLLPAGQNNAEIPPCQVHVFLLLRSHSYQIATEVFDRFPTLDKASRCGGGLMGKDCIAVCGRNLKWAIRKPHVYVLAHVALKVLLFSICSQIVEVFLGPGKLQKAGFGFWYILCDDDIVE